MSDELVRVELSQDYYTGEKVNAAPEPWWTSNQRDAAAVDGGLYDVPAEQAERWLAAQDAWAEAQAEIWAVMQVRFEQQAAERAERKAREERRRAEIRAQLYGGRRR